MVVLTYGSERAGELSEGFGEVVADTVFELFLFCLSARSRLKI